MDKLKNLRSKHTRPNRPTSSRLQPVLDDIEERWTTMIRRNYEDRGTLVGLPHPYVVPTAQSRTEFQFEEQYYWDSYFIAIGMNAPEHQQIVEGMLDNLMYLFKRFSLVPNASRMYMTSRSQPPLLTRYIFHVYDTYHKSPEWLESRMEVALSEYDHVWMNESHPLWHRVYKGLSRYYDVNVLHDLAEAESGWDMTPRFERKCLDFLPVDLNSLLYIYEKDFARYAEIKNDAKTAQNWHEAAARRAKAMSELMWAKYRGFFFDYNYSKKEQGGVWSLAAYYTMWAGLATDEQAERLVDNLVKFEKSGGLTTTTRQLFDPSLLFGSLRAQWAYPNGWSPLHFIVIDGLRRYGYNDVARRIALRWISTNIEWFENHGEFLEKYNVVSPHKEPVEGVYPSQTGFGWTNGVLVRLIHDWCH